MEEIGVRYDPSRVLEEVELPVVDVQAGAGDAVHDGTVNTATTVSGVGINIAPPDLANLLTRRERWLQTRRV
jgi:hypothetical protein